MHTEILVHRAHGETRVALLEDGETKELYFERDHHRGVVGNIYRGRVSRVLPGMQAAFVQIGLERAAFLYVGDVVDPNAPAPEDIDEDAERPADSPEPEAEAPESSASGRSGRPSIEALLTEGQELIVQVSKAPLGTKGARVTGYITLPGRYLVYMPTMRRIGVSRKISEEAERKRLRELLGGLQGPEDGGFIARTACEGLDEARVAPDVEFTKGLWEEVLQRDAEASGPTLLSADLDLTLRTTRDLFGEGVDKMTLNDPEQTERVRRLLTRSAPQLAERVHLDERADLFQKSGVERAFQTALSRTAPLPSGGSLVIDEVEALTAIDVNTGRFVGSNDLEATLLKTNLEAAEEVARQLRLRNLGGLIIIDFIDMQQPENREKVSEVLELALARDRARTHALPMSEFCLVELTRQRVRGSLGRRLQQPCPYCEGRGRIQSTETMSQSILRKVEQEAALHPQGSIMVRAMPEVAGLLSDDKHKHLALLEERLGRPVIIEASSACHQETFQVWVCPPGERPR